MIRRRLFTVVSAFSLLLCVASAAMWIRSDGSKSQQADPDSFDLTDTEPLYWFVSNPGKLTFCRQVGRDWGQPSPRFRLLGLEFVTSRVGSSSLSNLFVPYWMIVCLSLLSPMFWLRAWA